VIAKLKERGRGEKGGRDRSNGDDEHDDNGDGKGDDDGVERVVFGGQAGEEPADNLKPMVRS
jgi:hypothetical protein